MTGPVERRAGAKREREEARRALAAVLNSGDALDRLHRASFPDWDLVRDRVSTLARLIDNNPDAVIWAILNRYIGEEP